MNRQKLVLLSVIVLVAVAVPGWIGTAVLTCDLVAARWPYPVVTSSSPDGAYEVIVTRDRWIPTDMLDPAIIVRMNLIDRKSQESVDGLSVGIEEESDFSEPRIEWDGKTVRISGSDPYHEISIVLRVDRWRSTAAGRT